MLRSGFVDLISLNQRKQTVIKASSGPAAVCNSGDEEGDVIEMVETGGWEERS